MPSESETTVRLQIGHVLFMDLIGYSTLLLDEQRQYLEQLTKIVRGTEQVRSAKEAGKLIQLPVRDGMALVFFEGCTYLAQRDNASAQNAFEQARPAFEAAVKEAPKSAERHAGLGLLYAFMGRKGDAIKEGQRAVELKPESKDAVDGSLMNGYLALIYARVGENDLAIPLIERLLATPGAVDSANYSITVNDLKHRWEWDPIRDDSRFKRLIAEKGP